MRVKSIAVVIIVMIIMIRRVIIILGANVVGEWNETIGNPVDIGNDSEVVEQPAQSNSYAAAQPPQAPYGNRQPYVQAYGVSSNEGAVPAGANYGSGGYPAMSYAQASFRPLFFFFFAVFQ